MDFEAYIQNIQKTEDFRPTGVTKDLYLDIIEMSLEGYKMEELESRLPKDETEPVEDIQAYSRITAAIAVLLANGRKQDYRVLWERMMEACCRDFYRKSGDARVDFSVKEIMLAYKVMAPVISEETKKRWLGYLKRVDPVKNYFFVISPEKGPEKMHNINIYNMAGEYLRETEGLTDTTGYFDVHWPVQLERFDENGMYKDPNCPMLYDLTTRCQIQIMMAYGYRGKYGDILDAYLKKAGLFTLFMQSSAFEFPFGGRSNQFLFNEALIAANCEYEAARYKKLGDLKTAGVFKRCAHLAIRSVGRWLEEAVPPKHIKNFYPVESRHGTENYGYYDKYMVTLGCFTYIAYLSADDSIEEFPCPAEIGGYVFETSPAFHKIFANCKGHSIEIDTKADFHYDATGLGRFHKRGVPTELALSVPFTATPTYTLAEGLKARNLSICPGWEDGAGGVQYLSELGEGLEHALRIGEAEDRKVSFTVCYGNIGSSTRTAGTGISNAGEANLSSKTGAGTANSAAGLKGCEGIIETYILDENGLSIEAELIKPAVPRIYFTVPLFYTNGRDESRIEQAGEKVRVWLGEFCYRVETDGRLTVDEGKYGNRNGGYRLACIEKDGTRMKVRLMLERGLS